MQVEEVVRTVEGVSIDVPFEPGGRRPFHWVIEVDRTQLIV